MIVRNKFRLAIRYVVLVLVALFTLFPIILTILGSLKSLGQLQMDLFGLPNPVLWSNYRDVLDPKRSVFFTNLFNSTLIMAATVSITILMATMAGFALSKVKFLGRGLIYHYFLLGMLFPAAVAILPLYIEIRDMGLLDTYVGVILPQVAFGMPWFIMLARGFFMLLPKELEEAATIDGCGPWRYFAKIVIPLSAPILTTIGILSMVGSWNGYFLPLLILNSESLYTLPMGVMSFQGQYQFNWQLILAYLILAMVPVFIFYLLAQKYIIAGLLGGAVKE
ncbi:MAG TPA: carbohydrate ABC transporter permease [Spirochaetota bacterium]|nr:carbohydrate ABC transporter permease [Spirochaetota bacterium]